MSNTANMKTAPVNVQKANSKFNDIPPNASLCTVKEASARLDKAARLLARAAIRVARRNHTLV